MTKYVCIHSHFYQPPRENPWLDRIQEQESAAPFHDWNERISSECYRENGRSRIINKQNFVEGVSNNYSKMSFNIGPTLLSWLENFDARTYDYILEADIISKKINNGHGNALAQCYNHIIMPLANTRDKETQIAWGIIDFEKRFNRKPEGMWLPETAVDLETLEILASNKMSFVILAPRQASKVRQFSSQDWNDVSSENINTKIPYLIKLPSGGSIAAFFYDGAISKSVAFDGLLHNGEYFANRILSGFSPSDEGNQLVHIATDGESYGHHHKYGDMALAYALKKIEECQDVQLCNYGYFLEINPPQDEVQIFENSSWSCAHGIERWRSDCGCNAGSNSHWNQNWRAPLRKTLDELRDEVNLVFLKKLEKFNIDPWVVRNDFINVIFNRHENSNIEFLNKWIPNCTDVDDQVEFIKAFEIQRHLLFMYTSCAWFFDESSGIETVQVLQYALRAAELAEDLWSCPSLTNYLERLVTIPSNLPSYINGEGIYNKIIVNCKVGFFKIAAHYAIENLFKDPNHLSNVYCYDVKSNDLERIKFGTNRFVCGHAEFISRATYSRKNIMFVAIHLGENIISAGVSILGSTEEYQEFKKCLIEQISKADFSTFTSVFNKQFIRKIFTIKDLLPEDRNYLLKVLLAEKMSTIDSQYQKIYNDNYMLMTFLSSLTIEIPRPLKVSYEQVVLKLIIELFQEKITLLKTNELQRHLEEAERSQLDLKTVDLRMFFQDRLIDFAETVKSNRLNQVVLENFLFAIKFVLTISPNISLSEIQYIIFSWRESLETIPNDLLPITDAILNTLRIEKSPSI